MLLFQLECKWLLYMKSRMQTNEFQFDFKHDSIRKENSYLNRQLSDLFYQKQL